MSWNEAYLGDESKVVLERDTAAGMKMFSKTLMNRDRLKMQGGLIWWATEEISMDLGS